MRRAARKIHERRIASSIRRRRVLFRANKFVQRTVVLCVLLRCSCVAQAQNIIPAQGRVYFIGGSLLSNISTAQIDALDGSALCGVFQHGGGSKFGGFLGIAVPLFGTFSLAPELEYDDLSSSSTINAWQTNQMPQILAADGSSYANVARTRTYAASVTMAAVAGMLSYQPIEHLHVSGGPFAGVLIQHSFLETEQILSPIDAVYAENNLHTRTIYPSGPIPNVNSFQFGLALRAAYEFPVEPNIGLSPSVGWMIPFTNISAGGLHVFPANASLELVFHVPGAAQKERAVPASLPNPTIAASPTPSVPKHEAMEVSIKALGVEENGQQVSEPVLSIERTHVTEVYPMLHYVFFDDGSASIPARYDQSSAQTRASFNEKSLFKDDALEIHHHVLDIIGYRLVEYPNASVTLVGAMSEHSSGDSIAGPTIAMARAKAIQDYLTNVWGISRDRGHLRARVLPDAASDDHNPSGEAENRRVDIIPSTPDLTAPLWTEHIERVATPPRIDFVPAITTESRVGIRSAMITVTQHGHLLRQIDALADSTVTEYRWTLDDRSMPEAFASREDSLTYVFTAIDSSGDTARASGVIHLHEEARDTSKYVSDTANEKHIERYSLILFDYSSSQLDRTESQRIVRDMATDIQGGTHITLTGHTDRTGDESYNDALSRARAMQADEMLRAELSQLGKPEPSIAVEWRGGRDELFDNSIPEGRMLSRTVRATVENP